MKTKLVLLFSALLLTACGGGGGSGSAPPPVPTSGISGKAADGLIIQGTVRVFDFTGGVVGTQLASATTNNVGSYSIGLQAESRPILVEVSGGYYIEERSALQVPLETGQVLTALTNFTMGQNVTVSATAYTHIAAGLARRLIATGATVPAAITEANNRVTQWLGVPILSTLPVDITIAASSTANVTPEHQYGFLSGAISSWTYDNVPSGVGHTKPYRSIDFIQKMYLDILADGLLNGLGAGAAPLSFGNRALGPRIYRTEIGVHVLTIAGHARNRTSLSATQLLPFATSYAANTDTMFNNVPTEPITSPVVSITAPTSNAWVSGIINVTATAQDYVSFVDASLSVDSVVDSTITTGLAAPLFALNTAGYSDGAHNLSVAVTNIVGLVGSASVAVRVDNVPPTITTPIVSGGGQVRDIPCTVTGTVVDGLSGPGATIAATWSKGSASAAITNGSYSFVVIMPGALFDPGDRDPTPVSLVVSDVAGNESSRSVTVAMRCLSGCRSSSANSYCVLY